MEPESHAAGLDTEARLSRARSSIDASAMQIKNALGSIIALTDTPTHSNQPLWRRLDVFARADLGDILGADAQSDIAHYLRPLVSLHDRLAGARWEVSSADEAPTEATLTGRGGGTTTTTTIAAVELLAEIFTAVAGAIESLNTRLTAQTIFTAPIPTSERAYVREIQTIAARISTASDSVWTWETWPDPIE